MLKQNLRDSGLNVIIGQRPGSPTYDLAVSHGLLYIQSNDVLTNLSGLSGLTNLGLGLSILDNDALTNLSFLNNVTTINGIVHIHNNAQLNNITAIKNIDPSGINNFAFPSYHPLVITNNPLLSECDVLSICSYLAIPANNATISGNGANCINRTAVETACAPTASKVVSHLLVRHR